MIATILRRLLWAIPLLLGVSLITFVMVALTPGDPAVTILGPTATAEQIERLRESLGLNLPWYEQYWSWLSNAVRGDLGTSLVSGQSVLDQLNARLPVTLSLAISATIVCAIIGIALGSVSASRGGMVSRITDSVAMLGFAIPNFWLGIVLVSIFAVGLRWFPPTGYAPLSDGVNLWAAALVLPVATLAFGGMTTIAKQTRDSMKDVLARDFIDSLRAEGWSEGRIVYRHALRNAAIPIVTIVGVFFTGMLGGTVLVENVFAMPGLGGLAVTATVAHDLPVILGVTLYFCIGVVIINLLVDLAYLWLDPKARTAA